MKVSKLFHWLYASVMFIPLLITALLGLAVRSDNNFQPIEVQAQDYEIVNFNQLVKNGNFEYGSNYWTTDNATLIIENETAYCLASAFRGSLVTSEKYLPTIDNQKIVVKAYIKTTADAGDIDLYFYGGYGYVSNIRSNDFQWLDKYVTTSNSWGADLINNNNIRLEDRRTTGFDDVEVKFVMAFNLTQMFGLGNEPTLEEFNQYFPNDYYEYTTSKKLLLNVGTTTLSDTDVGSQMVYTLYNATDKYFNFNQFLGIGNLFDWFQLNVFNGNAPLGFIIFWNLLIYWLIVSIAWLIFDIAMYVPKLAHRWLDKASLE